MYIWGWVLLVYGLLFRCMLCVCVLYMIVIIESMCVYMLSVLFYLMSLVLPAANMGGGGLLNQGVW